MKSRIFFCITILAITTFLAIQSFNLLAQAKAIAAAKQFKPESYVICTQVVTPAVHTETGAKHVFSTDCLPPGWTVGE